MANKSDRPILIGIAGGSGSGKTYFARQIREAVGQDVVSILSMDQYFITEDSSRTIDINFDHPAHLDFDLMLAHIDALRKGASVVAPGYDFKQRKSTPDLVRIEARPVVLIEGLFVLAHPVVDLLDLSCFLDVDLDQRLLGRILRDLHERGSTIEAIVDRYQRFVRPSYHIFVAPSRQNADIVVDFTYRRHLFLDMFVGWIQSLIAGAVPIDQVVSHLRTESYRMGYISDVIMPLAVDIRELAKAFPESKYMFRTGESETPPHLLVPEQTSEDSPEL